MTVIGSTLGASDHHSGYYYLPADAAVTIEANKQMIVYQAIELAAGATLTLVGDLVVIF